MKKPSQLALAAAVLAALSSTQAAAATRCVNPGGTGGCFSTLAAAIAASAPTGDSIVIAEGTYFERDVQVNKSVDITGAGVGRTIIDGSVGGANGPANVLRYPGFAFRVTMTLSHLTVQRGARGIDAGAGNNVTVDHVRVTGNGPETGAGIFNGSSNLFVRDSTIDGNSATNEFSIAGCDWGGGAGGGIASLCGGGSNFISNSTITGNTASRWGGGLIVNDGVTVIENSTISGNHALHGDPNLGGGGMFVGGGFPDITIRYSTIANNTAVGAGGGLWGGDDPNGFAKFRVEASVLQGNTPDNCLDKPFIAAVPIKSLGYNVSSDASCVFTQAADANSTDAMLGPLQDNGGATHTHAPAALSPAVDRIFAASCSVAADQRGTSRPRGPACDSGAYEWVDTTRPVVAAHADVTVEATGPSGAAATYTAPGASDDQVVASQSCAPASGSTFPVGTSTVTCSATDAQGNTGSNTFAVNVVDTTPPTVTVPAGISVLQASPAGTAVTFSATASDLVDGTAPVACAPASGSTFAAGDTTVRCTATDAHGNLSGVASFNVHVAGVQEQIDSLLVLVTGVGPGNSLLAKVATVLALAASQHHGLACGVLNALLNEVRAQAGKKIPVAKAAEITTAVNQLRAALGCN